jgi:isoquinoline 1-oxidoreductase alpha subunit
MGEDRTGMIEFTVNGVARCFDGAPDTPLLLVIRDTLELTGTKFGCGAGLCGACTVHVDGRALRSCTVSAADAAGARLTTIEGLSADRSHPVQRAWAELDVPQCGYCQPGMIMAAAALLAETSRPTLEQIGDGITNLCRCGTYARVRAAVLRAAQLSGRG